MDRGQALDLLKTHVSSQALLRHSFAVEGAMRAYAAKYNENVERWGMIGLLHDVDFEKYPENHPSHAPELLEGHGFDKDFIESILSHGIDGDALRTSISRKCLFAVDKMTSFIVAVALMRPTKLEGLGAKSVKKKMKDKAFAKAVDRDELISSMEAMDVEFGDHVDTIVAGLIEHEKILQKDGYSLVN